MLFLLRDASSDLLTSMFVRSAPFRVEDDVPLKEMVTLTSKVGSLVRETRMQSKHKTIKLIFKTLRMKFENTCVEVVASEHFLDYASLHAFEFLLFTPLIDLVTLLLQHV